MLLYVEDDPSVAKLFIYALRHVNCAAKVFIVGDCKHALDFLQQQPPYQEAPRPDLLVLDIELPGTDGFETLKAVRNNPGLLSIPALFFSSSRHEANHERALAAGASTLVNKPADLNDFEQAVRHICSFALTAALPIESS